MPELPEVETVVRDLRPLLVGRRVEDIHAGRRKLRTAWNRGWHPLVKGRKIESVQRRGKWIAVLLEGDTWLLLHLGMTGQLRVVDRSQPQAAHTHLRFRLDCGELRFRDVRRFGCARVLSDADAAEKFYARARLGPEPFHLDRDYWRQRLSLTRRCLKAVLLDQRVVAGIGNIYADEALFEARLHPARQACELRTAELDRLRRALPVVLQRAIERRGSSIRDYLDGNGERGTFQREFCVYQRTGEPCVRCKTRILQVRLAGRSTHFCPRCQPDH